MCSSDLVRGVVAAQRSYLITHRDSDRRSYRYARDRVPAESAGLRIRVQDGEQLRILLQLTGAIDERLQRLDASLDDAAATAVASQQVGEHLDGLIDNLLQQLRGRELRLLNARRATTDANASVATYLMNWGMAFACALLVWEIGRAHV